MIQFAKIIPLLCDGIEISQIFTGTRAFINCQQCHKTGNELLVKKI